MVWLSLNGSEIKLTCTKFGVRFHLITKLSWTQSTDWVRFCSIEFDFWKFNWLCWKSGKVEFLWDPIHSVFLKQCVLYQKETSKGFGPHYCFCSVLPIHTNKNAWKLWYTRIKHQSCHLHKPCDRAIFTWVLKSNWFCIITLQDWL